MTKERLPSELRVKAWMNAPEHTVRPNTCVDEAFALLNRERIHHLLVMDGDDLVGVVTDRDLRRPDWHGDDVLSVRDMYVLGDELRVCDVMSADVITVTPEAYTARAARMMVDNRFNCLPVVDAGRVLGIVTSTDLLRALVPEVDPVAIEVRATEAS